MTRRLFPAALIAVLLAFGAAAADYPSRPIRIIVPFSAGSATDIIARLVGSKLTESWGQQVVIDNRPSAGGTVAGGIVASSALLALGVTSAHRLPMLQNVPTIAEAAIPGFEYEGWYGVFVPSQTPRIIVNHISREVGRSLLLPDVYEKISSTGAVPRPTTPEDFDRKVRDEIAMRGKIFKASGAKAE